MMFCLGCLIGVKSNQKLASLSGCFAAPGQPTVDLSSNYYYFFYIKVGQMLSVLQLFHSDAFCAKCYSSFILDSIRYMGYTHTETEVLFPLTLMISPVSFSHLRIDRKILKNRLKRKIIFYLSSMKTRQCYYHTPFKGTEIFHLTHSPSEWHTKTIHVSIVKA
jgi:hypothetical protein